MAKIYYNSIIFLLVLVPVVSSLPLSVKCETPQFRKGLWVEAEGVVRPLNHPPEFQRLLRTLEKYDFTDVYLQVYRNGKSWFESEVSNTSPYIENSKNSFDPISELLSFCNKRNIRVHAWMNVLRMNAEAPLLKKNGASVVLHDGSGNSLLETKGEGVPGCRPDTPGIWLDPDHVEVKKNTLMVLNELLTHYPEFSGVHFDYLRYPFPVRGEAESKLPFCTHFYSLEKIKENKSIRTRIRNHLLDTSLKTRGYSDSFGDGVTNFLKVVRRYLDIKAPHLEVSGAVLSNVKRALRHSGQDWPLWLKLGLLDNVVTMNYTTNEKRFFNEAKTGSRIANGRILIGIGAWLSLDAPSIVARDLRNIQQLDVKGSVLFSYANLAGKKGAPIFRTLHSFSPVKSGQ